jgi:hypothetical protein
MPPEPLGMPPLPLVGFCEGVGVWNFVVVLLLGGFSTNEVSVVRKVASTSGTFGSCPLLLAPTDDEKSGWFWGRLKDSGIGA